jgi:translation initiation factor IF-3
LSHPFPSRNFSSSSSFVRVNGKIRAREVRVIGPDGKQVGVLSLGEALSLARSHGVDLVEVSAAANPPVCRIVDFGKYRYELAKREKESKKHHHASTVKEVQLSPRIDAHDLSVKIGHAVDFLCEDMKVKVTLKFRGREMAHTEFGFGVVRKFLTEIAPYGHPDSEPKLIGRGINVMVSPLPRNKRSRNPRQVDGEGPAQGQRQEHEQVAASPTEAPVSNRQQAPVAIRTDSSDPQKNTAGFSNNPFAQLETK